MSNPYFENLMYDTIATEGTHLISDYFCRSADKVFYWSPNSLHWKLAFNTALVVGEIGLTGNTTEKLKTLCRHFYKKAGVRELSYVEYFGNCSSTSMWVMLVDNPCRFDLKVGVSECRAATWKWSIKRTILETGHPRRWFAPIFNLLIPQYPDCEQNLPLDQLILPGFTELDWGPQADDQRSIDIGGHHND